MRSQPLSAWAEELGIPEGRIWNRLDVGWTEERALSV